MYKEKESSVEVAFLAILGWAFAPVIHLIVTATLAIPMYLMWNAVAPTYFTFLPTAWLSFTWVNMWAMLFIVFTIRSLVATGGK
jgi:hypothetical protein